MLGPLYELANSCENLVHSRLGVIGLGTEELELSRFVFNGPRGGGDPVRFGLFAGIHGDEPAGVIALSRLLEQLARRPEMAEGYRLLVYPACNPSGLMAGSRHSRRKSEMVCADALRQFQTLIRRDGCAAKMAARPGPQRGCESAHSHAGRGRPRNLLGSGIPIGKFAC